MNKIRKLDKIIAYSGSRVVAGQCLIMKKREYYGHGPDYYGQRIESIM